MQFTIRHLLAFTLAIACCLGIYRARDHVFYFMAAAHVQLQHPTEWGGMMTIQE